MVGSLELKALKQYYSAWQRWTWETLRKRDSTPLQNSWVWDGQKQTPPWRRPLDSTKDMASKTAPLISSMVVSVGPLRPSRNPQLVATKIIVILVILCRSAHKNNSNYLPLLIALYIYFAGARVDAITLPNHLGPLVSYDVFSKKKLRNITSTSTQWTRQERIHM